MNKAVRRVPKRTTDLVKQVSVAPCSIEFGRDTKGNPKWTIKIYAEAEDLESVADRVIELDKKIKELCDAG